jgi:ATP adenylyltransferase
MEYVGSAGSDDTCIFCSALDQEDEKVWVLYRGETTFALLNAYPYNTGHLMVAPTRHVGELEDLSDEERRDLMDLTTKSVAAMRDAMAPDGFNIGMNLGRIAGAGVPGHLHVHVVPRWSGDTNFMPVVGDTKVLPEMLASTYAKLKPGFANV